MNQEPDSNSAYFLLAILDSQDYVYVACHQLSDLFRIASRTYLVASEQMHKDGSICDIDEPPMGTYMQTQACCAGKQRPAKFKLHGITRDLSNTVYGCHMREAYQGL